MGMILRIASSRIVGQGDIVGRSGYFSLNLSANSVMRGRLDARRTLKSLVADLRFIKIRRIGRNLPLQATDVIIVVLARSRYACRCRKKRTKQSHTDKLSLHNQIKLVKTYNSLLSLLPLINFYLYARGGNSIP